MFQPEAEAEAEALQEITKGPKLTALRHTVGQALPTISCSLYSPSSN